MPLKIDKQLQYLIGMLPCCIYWKNREGVYIKCNDMMAQLAGFSSPLDMLGKTDFDLSWKDKASSLHEKDLTVMASGVAITVEEELVLPNGKVGAFLSCKAPFISDENEEISSVFGVFTDLGFYKQPKDDLAAIQASDYAQINMLSELSHKITGHKLAKNTTVQEYATYLLDYLENIIGCMPGSVYWKDRDGIYRGGNDYLAQIAGFKSRKEIVGKTDNDFAEAFHWSKEMVERVVRFDMAVMELGIPKYNYEELPFKDADGNEIVQLSNKVPLFDKNNNVIGLVGISVDITERKQMEEELKIAKNAAESADHAKTEFIANMSHDIRTPLSGVVGLANILEDRLQDPNQKSLAHDLSQSGTELLNMLNEILDVISADNINTNDIHEEIFDLRRLVQGIVDLEEPSTILKKIQLLANIDEKIPNILIGDQKKIHHILLNLVGNSIKFTTTGCVEIKIILLEKQKNSVQLQFQIIDTGKGIPPEALDKIFDAFYRVSPSYKGLDKGHGLGLHIAQSYTQLLGGKISVASKLDEGSKFSFSLALKIADKDAVPQNVPQESSKLHPKASPSSPPSTSADSTQSSDEPLPDNAPQILVIEDNHVARTIAETLLRNAKCSVTTASDGESGLEMAKNRQFDLIISDVGLPGISGLEVARQLRDDEKKRGKPAVPLIGLTAHVGGSTHNDCINSGMNEVIIKPMNAETIETLCSKFFLGEGTKLPAVDTSRSPEFAATPKPQKSGGLGEDLPDTETELFSLEPLLIFDVDKARKILGNNNTLLMDLIKTTITSLIPEELLLMKQAHDTGNWKTVSRIAHKLKGGFLSIGLTRAATACQYLERYYKAGHTVLLEKLYAQVLETLDTTSVSLKSFIR